ncbi:glycoside hydrolase family 3 N-terminal domain-containing protein [Arthrobacter silvisoli]|uniref:glycoside hydrolase family 3 N-terminal domain-containing protein n=1 Tax=Arthrobacter silvisoli TaxID=2291022 RepID=UPI001FE80D94|nr:glycoside hydrolase family 3 N-terminal domain-containing protein [Arthrobacter silvisoli]
MGQRIGQLFMVAANATGASSATLSDLSSYHVGNAYLSGRSAEGTTATAAVVRRMTQGVSAATTGNVRLLVGTDQEGGYVQVLSGPGFSTIPTALSQGTLAPATLQGYARTWGGQLAAAGLNLNLAPVLDTVPSAAFAPLNAPIGYYEREYGYTPATVSSHGLAFAAGMRQAGLVTAVKHFPGLGRVTANTDTSTNVHDTVTTVTDPYLQPFRDAVNAGTGIVMVSSAYYDKIDPAHIGPFSGIIMKTMLRASLGFNGVILSDDLCNAAQLAPWSLAERAVNFFSAGGTMLLCANPASIPAMYRAVLSRAQSSTAFDAVVNAAALNVLQLKAGAIPNAFGHGATSYMTDFNGDGTGDVLARDAAGALWLYAGKGNGTWFPRVQVGGGWQYMTALLSPGDFNGDGTGDVLARDAGGALWLYPGKGSGTWFPRVQVGGGWQYMTALLSPGDFNGDGAADVLARDPSGALWLYPGNGRGLWFPRVQVGGGWQYMTALFSPGDFNGDGAADVLARDPSGALWLYPGKGNGTWFPRVQVGGGWQNMTALFSPGDFNGDGAADVLARDPSGALWLYPGKGNGTWFPRVQVGGGWQNMTAIF